MSYLRGRNRLWYKSKTSDSEKSVEIDFLNPKLERTNKLPMIFLEDNTYYIDIWFKNIGSYLIRVFEDGDKKHENILVVSTGNHIIYPDMNKLI